MLYVICNFIINHSYYLKIIIQKQKMKQGIKTFKFNFHATLREFVLNAPKISSPLVATWKRSEQSVSSSAVQMVGGKANFNQKITLPVNMYFQEGKQQFQAKKTLMTFTMHTPNGQKQAGIVYIDVAQMLNKQLNTLSETYILQKCPVKDSKVNIQIDAEVMGEVNSDTISIQQGSQSQIFQSSQFQKNPSSLSIQSKRDITPQQKPQKPSKGSTSNDRQLQQKNRYIATLQQNIKNLSKQKQQLSREVQRRKAVDSNSQGSKLKEQLIKSKQIQQKLQSQINNLKSQNIEHERQLQKMRVRMQQIYQLLFDNLNNLY